MHESKHKENDSESVIPVSEEDGKQLEKNYERKIRLSKRYRILYTLFFAMLPLLLITNFVIMSLVISGGSPSSQEEEGNTSSAVAEEEMQYRIYKSCKKIEEDDDYAQEISEALRDDRTVLDVREFCENR